MTDKSRAREFYLLKDDLDFDLNWKKIHAAEYPYKDSVTNALRVIDYKAYLAIQQELDEARRVIEYYGDTSLGETGAWAFEKKFVFGRVQNEDMELLTEPLGAKGERYAIGGKKAREYLAKYPKKEG